MKKGFTLIEVMIVITIIGLLAAILLPNMTRSRQQALLSACESNMRSMAAALESYATDDSAHSYPTATMSTTALNILKNLNYINAIPVCPDSKGQYVYSGVQGNYTIEHGGTEHSVLLGASGYPKITGEKGLYTP